MFALREFSIAETTNKILFLLFFSPQGIILCTMTPEEEPGEGRKIWNRKEKLEKDENDYKGEDSKCDNYANYGSDCHNSANFGEENHEDEQRKSNVKFEPQVKWLDLTGILFVHLGCIYGFYLLIASRSIKNYAWRKWNKISCMTIYHGYQYTESPINSFERKI